MNMDLLDYIRIILGKVRFIKTFLVPFNKLIRKYSSWKMNRLFMKYGELTFQTFVDTLSSSNLRFWPEFGTLLGIYRDGDFIKYDNDFDFGAFVDDIDAIHSLLTSAGFVREYLYYSKELNYVREATYSWKGVHIDIFYFKSEEEHDICYSFIPNSIDGQNGLCYKIKYFTFEKIELMPIVFKGLKLTIPKDTQHHLMVSYGPHFMIPDPNFKSINHNFIEGYYAYRCH